MRYYDLTLTQQGSTTPYRQWSSQSNGVFNPAALNIEFDIPSTMYAEPAGAASIMIHGVSLDDLVQSSKWGLTMKNGIFQPGMNLTLKAGMQAGLPLANPAQAGLILSGQIVQSFGNWEGTDMTVNFIGWASQYTEDNPGNIVLSWLAGMTLQTALTNCLTIAYPGKKLEFHISPSLVISHDQHHLAATLDDLAIWVEQHTRLALHNRVDIAINGDTIFVADSLYKATPIQINFTDMIGQPVWIEPGIMQVKFVLRADLTTMGSIKMPAGLQDLPGIALTQAASMHSQLRTKTTFPSTFKIVALRHVGNFRSTDGGSWATIANCAVPDIVS